MDNETRDVNALIACNSSQSSVGEDGIVDLEVEFENSRKRRKLEEIQKRPIPNFNNLQSKVYSQFIWLTQVRQWKCKHCSHQYTHSSKGGSASLSNHLKAKHQSVMLNCTETCGNRSVGQFYEVLPKTPKTVSSLPITEIGFKEKLIEFIVSSDQPFSLVENPFFINFVDYCTGGNEKTKLPTKKTMQKWISEKYEAHKENLVSALQQNESKVSFIIDGWTSSNQKPFQGVMGAWINKDWELCQTVLDLTVLPGSHTGVAIADAFKNVLDSFNLWNKLHAVTTDNASNLDTFFRKLDDFATEKMVDFNSAEYRVRCLAHILNLACRAIIDSVLTKTPEGSSDGRFQGIQEDDSEEDLICSDKEVFLVTLRKAIRGIRSSTQRRELFEKFCEKFGMTHKNLLLDVETRWNSTTMMLRRVSDFKKPFIATVQHDKNLRQLKITEESDIWTKVEVLLKLLQPFEEATLMLSQGHSPTLSDTATVYMFLFDHLEKYTNGSDEKLLRTRSKTKTKNSSPEWLIESANKGWEKLQKYYKYNDDLVHVVATVKQYLNNLVMDPRYKLNWFKISWEKKFVDSVRKKVTEIWTQKYKQCEEIAPSAEQDIPDPSSNISSLLAEKMQEFHRSDELNRYLKETVTNPSNVKYGVEGALYWWKIHQDDFPQLSKMARDFLAVSATGVPVERLFSSGPDLLSPKRQRLNAKTIQQCMCLKQWIRSKDIIYIIDDLKPAILHKLGIESIEEEKDDV